MSLLISHQGALNHDEHSHNIAAMAALQTLRTMAPHGRDASACLLGLRVGQAAGDDAAYWSIATTMRSDNMALSAVQDALGLGAAKVGYRLLRYGICDRVVKEIKKKLVAATKTASKAKIRKKLISSRIS